MNETKPAGNGEGEVIAISLPEFLNIFVRGRWLVVGVTLLGVLAGLAYGWIVKPLYLGTVQVRPGIVTFSASGDPIRGWALKDVVQWFDSQRFWGEMKQSPEFSDWDGAPVIRAEFIPSGLQWTPGGNIITLSNLSRDPANCELILRNAVESFNAQAMADTNDSDIALAIGRSRLKIQDYRNDVEQVNGDEERALVDIKSKRGDLELVEARAQRLQFARERLEKQKAWRVKAISGATSDLVSARTRLEQAQQMLSVALEAEELESAGGPARGSDENPVTDILLSSARREQAGRVVQLLDSIGRLEKYIFDGQVKIDTLNTRIGTLDIALEDVSLQERVDLVQQRERILDEIALLEIQLKRDLPHERARLGHLVAEEEMKISKLEALEQISPIQVTNKPVRPRRMRAVVILGGLAFFASLGLVLVREYFLRNREAILAR